MLAEYALTFLVGVRIVGLLPIIRDTDAQIPRLTSVPTMFVWWGLVVTYLAMDLVYSALICVVGGLLWLYIFVKRPMADDTGPSTSVLAPNSD